MTEWNGIVEEMTEGRGMDMEQLLLHLARPKQNGTKSAIHGINSDPKKSKDKETRKTQNVTD